MASSDVTALGDAQWNLVCAETEKMRAKADLRRAEAEFARAALRHRRALARVHELTGKKS